MRENKEFLWGSATSSFQVSGGDGDWEQWLEEYADELADTAKDRIEGRSDLFAGDVDWDAIQEYAEDSENYINECGADHFNRYEEDIQLLDELNQNAFRLSLPWAWIEPEKGVYDDDVIDHFHDVFDTLHEHDIEPVVTLWHYTFPEWVDEDGWQSDETVERFKAYVDRMANEYSDDVDIWLTVNEPVNYAFERELGDWLSPVEQDNADDQSLLNQIQGGVQAVTDTIQDAVAMKETRDQLGDAHRAAYDTLKDADPDNRVSFPKHYLLMESYNDTALNTAFAEGGDWWLNDRFVDRVKDEMDFYGMNFYMKAVPRIELDTPPTVEMNADDVAETSDMGWSTETEPLYKALHEVAEEYDMPIIVTENGIADARDQYREQYIEGAVDSVQRARDDGVPVEGYLHWSLLDNFEWDYGHWPDFGLIEVTDDYGRVPRDSAYRYAELIEHTDMPDIQDTT